MSGSSDDFIERIATVRAYDRDVEHILQAAARRRGADAEAVLAAGLRKPVRRGALGAILSVLGIAAGAYLSMNPNTRMPWGAVLEDGGPMLAIFSSSLILALFFIFDTVQQFKRAPEAVAESAREVAQYDLVREGYASGIRHLERSLRRKDLGPVLGIFVLPNSRR